MKMGSKTGLVPITRAFLSSYYDKHHFPSISEDVTRLTQQLYEMSNNLRNTTSLPLPQGLVYRSFFYSYFYRFLSCNCRVLISYLLYGEFAY